jgi:hypothetical protein
MSTPIIDTPLTEEEKAVAIFELRERGMHPEWVKWFTWYQGGTHVPWLLDAEGLINNYTNPPSEGHRMTMRTHGFTFDD